MWNGHFKRTTQPDRVTVSDEMRRAFHSWIKETYNIDPGPIEFDSVDTVATFTMTLGMYAPGYSRNGSLKFLLHPCGEVVSALIIHGDDGCDRRFPFSGGGLLPEDKETRALENALRVCRIWKDRPVGWHPSHKEMLECLQQMAKTANIDSSVLTVTSLLPSDKPGIDKPGIDGKVQYGFTLEGLQLALAHARAMVVSGQAYMKETPLSLGTAKLIVGIFPGTVPLKTGEWLTTVDSRYADWFADMPETYSDSPSMYHWENVTPMYQ